MIEFGGDTNGAAPTSNAPTSNDFGEFWAKNTPSDFDSSAMLRPAPPLGKMGIQKYAGSRSPKSKERRPNLGKMKCGPNECKGTRTLFYFC